MNTKATKPLLLLAVTALLASCGGSVPSIASSGQQASSDATSAAQQSSAAETSENSSESQETSAAATSSEQGTSSQQGASSQASAAQSSQQAASSQAPASSAATSQYTPSTEALPTISYIKVFAPKSYTNVWAWTRNGSTDTNLFANWPGEKLTSYNEVWNTYDFQGHADLWVIVNNGGDSLKTADFELNKAGYWWYDGKQWVNTNVEPEIQGGGAASSDWQGQPGNIYIDPEGYKAPDPLPTPSYTEVASAKDYSELPAVKNYNGHVVNKYSGSRKDFRDESIYFTITTRFYDGDSSNNTHCWDAKNDATTDPNWRGDFKGLIDKMDYIKALGFTAIWITPVVKNASGFDYHGYHAINFKEVDPRYESEDVDFQKVIDEAHKRDMKIVLDVVFNHTCNFGEENLFPMFYYDAAHNTSFKGLIRRKNGMLPDSYDTSNNPGGMRFDLLKTDKGDPTGIYHHDPDGSLSWEQYSEQTGQIAGDCVDLNTENPTVANYLVEAYAKFIEMGVDAFRVDTVKHISRLTMNKYFVPAFKAIAKKARGDDQFHLFGEICVKDSDVWNRGQQADSVPFYSWAETKSWGWGDKATNAASAKAHWSEYLMPTNHLTSQNAYLNGVTYHTPDHSKFSGMSAIDFPMHWNFDNTRNSFGVAVGNDSVYNDATYNVTYVDSHDYGPNEQQTVRFNRGTNAWKERLSLLFTFRGVPCIYYGSELEFKAGKTIDNGPNLALENSGRAYFGDNITGKVNVTGFGSFTNPTDKLATALSKPLPQHIAKLSKARLACIALRRGQYTTSNVSGSGIAFTRRYTADGVDSVAAVCINGNANFSSLPNGTYKDLYGGGTIPVSNGSLSANAQGEGGIQIWVRQ